ncbi:MAG: hypothetical protein QGI34_03035, partial [Candidatus Latescibacteria bacterium]|nr:hypothetical protein [Candidatus Latescibacterota bacterium]
MTNKHHPVLIFYRLITLAFQRMPFVFILSIGTFPILAQEASTDQGVSWYQAGEYSRAREIFLQIIKDQPEHPVALYHLGRLETAHPAAEQYYLQVLLHAPQHPYADDALLDLADVAGHGGQGLVHERRVVVHLGHTNAHMLREDRRCRGHR